MSAGRSFDDAVVGAGILGLAHAYHLAKRGRKVVVFERNPRAQGASVRNFGMIWPIGQPRGTLRTLALRSRAIWLDVLQTSRLWHDPMGSIHLAYQGDEEAVLREFAARAGADGFDCQILSAREVLARSPLVRTHGLRAGLFSPWDLCVDPRDVLAHLPEWLAREHRVTFEFNTTVLGYERKRVLSTFHDDLIRADRLWICAGDDFQTLYSEAFRDCGLVRCKLQMLRTAPLADGVRIGPMLAAGLTLRHYQSFADCPSLPALKARIARETPLLDRYGIHVLASQNGRGEVTLGDSHEYGDAIEPFDKCEIEALILGYLETFLDVAPRIVARWNGTYAKHPTAPYVIVNPAGSVTAIAATGGAGMTLSFGLAEQVVARVLAEADSR
jgi:FAD dependent oxidoreductase TIGR03364